MKNRNFLIIATVIFSNLCFCIIVEAQEIDYYVGVHYYPWYYNDFHGGQYLREHLVPPQLPEIGEYNDRDHSVINTHIRWSLRAGIDFWSTSWWGPGSREDVTLLNYILQNPNLGNIKIAILYETVGRTNNFQDYSVLGPDITYLANNYFSHPNYLKINGKPVIIVYLTRVLSAYGTLQNSLSSMRQAAANAGYELYIMGDQVFGSPPASAGDIALLDAIMNYVEYASPTTIDDSTSGSDYTGGFAYEGYGMRYLDILCEETYPQSTLIIPWLKILLLE